MKKNASRPSAKHGRRSPSRASTAASRSRVRGRLSTLQWWLTRAGMDPLDQVYWSTHSRAPIRIHNCTPPEVELAVLACRQRLTTTSALGFRGAQTIADTLRAEGTLRQLPSVRTISRILQRHGVLDGRRRLRRPALPPGWYVPVLHLGQAEVDAFDVIKGLVIEGGGKIEVLTGKALWARRRWHGRCPA